MLEGRCEIDLGEARVRSLGGAGDLVVAPRGDAHRLCSPEGRRVAPIPSMELARASRGGRITGGGGGEQTVILCGAFVFHHTEEAMLSALPRLVHVPSTGTGTPGWLTGYVAALESEAADEGPGSSLVQARLASALVVRALRVSAEVVEEPGWLRGLGDPRIARALAVMHDRLSEPWTLATLGREAGLSRAAFAQRFRALVGEPTMAYLRRCRMRRAMRMLEDGPAALATVSAAVGYGSEAALSAAFKRYLGQSPGAYARAGKAG